MRQRSWRRRGREDVAVEEVDLVSARHVAFRGGDNDERIMRDIDESDDDVAGAGAGDADADAAADADADDRSFKLVDNDDADVVDKDDGDDDERVLIREKSLIADKVDDNPPTNGILPLTHPFLTMSTSSPSSSPSSSTYSSSSAPSPFTTDILLLLPCV